MKAHVSQLSYIPVFKPSYGAAEFKALKKVLQSGWTGLGPETEAFENEFAEYIGVRYAVAVNSCTAALHLALKVAGVEGGEVITTPMTFVATNHAILYNSSIPVFCDIEPDTLNIDPACIEALVTKKTRAIMAVHYGGHACDMDALRKIAKKYRLRVIEDCAHACGGEYKEIKLGSFGDLGCFSFQAVKNLSTGDGGMITTNSKCWHAELKKLRWMGITQDTWTRKKTRYRHDWKYNVESVGFKYHMNDLTAALGRVQLSKLESLNERRRRIVREYDRGLQQLSHIEKPFEKDYAKSAWHSYVIKLSKRNALHLFLQERGISTGIHYYPNHLYPVYRTHYRRLPVAERVWKKILSLPLYPDLSVREAHRIVACIREFYEKEYVQ